MNKGGSSKVAVYNDHEVLYKGRSGKVEECIHHHEVITKEEREKFAVYNDHHEVKTKEEVQKLRYLMIIMKL